MHHQSKRMQYKLTKAEKSRAKRSKPTIRHILLALANTDILSLTLAGVSRDRSNPIQMCNN